jgi:Fe-S-cluster containining protein
MRSSSTTSIIHRPVWRRVKPRYLAFAAAHVRAGGLAVVVPDHGRMRMLLPVEPSGRLTTLALWALLSIEHRRAPLVREGPAKGLRSAVVKKGYEGSVLDWCERDQGHEGPMRRIALDCTECAACCRDADVVLDAAELVRWRGAGRPELADKPYVRRARDGKITLRFLPNGRCPHLRKDKRCGIYPLRPDNCRAFLAGSEACLAAREETLGLRDG